MERWRTIILKVWKVHRRKQLDNAERRVLPSKVNRVKNFKGKKKAGKSRQQPDYTKL